MSSSNQRVGKLGELEPGSAIFQQFVIFFHIKKTIAEFSKAKQIATATNYTSTTLKRFSLRYQSKYYTWEVKNITFYTENTNEAPFTFYNI